MDLLKEKNIIITGSGRGIGKAVAIACAKQGANIGITSRTEDELTKTRNEINKLGIENKVVIKTADITNYDEIETVFKEFNDELGFFNGIIANAGTSRMGDTHNFDSKSFDFILKVNVLGVFNTFKASYPFLNKEDKKNKAKFIITGSEAYPQGMPKFAAYTASKYATVGLQKALATEYRRENITFNQILPTMVDTELLRGKKAGNGNKPESVMNPWDLNDYYIFLLSDLSNRVNDELIMSSDIQNVLRLIKEAPTDSNDSWDKFKGYLEENYSKTYNKVKKLGRLIDFLIKR